MAQGDFANKIQPNIKNLTCQSCGQNHWSVVEEVNGDVPAIPLQDPSGSMKVPAPSIPIALAVCDNCGMIRAYAFKQ